MNTVRLLAEFEPHRAVQLSLPHPFGDWEETHIAILACFREIITQVTRYQEVILVVHPQMEVPQWVYDLPVHSDDKGRVQLHRIATNDSWSRDYGAITVINDRHELELHKFVFNGWGLKFSANLDNALTTELHNRGAFAEQALHLHPFVFEGGAMETDGQGTLMTTWQCLESPHRNQGLSRTAITEYLAKTLGVKRVLGLEHGELIGDDTDAHIDTLARFCNPTTIAYVQCTDQDDPHFPALQRMEKELRSLRTMDGHPYHLIPLPLPTPQWDGDRRLPATYANFLILNEAVLVPVYKCATDAEALGQCKLAFPEREVIGIDCRALIQQNGSLHCATMQYY